MDLFRVSLKAEPQDFGLYILSTPMNRLAEFLQVVEMDDGAKVAGALFQRRFGHTPPTLPHHMVALYRHTDGEPLVACYVHFLPHRGMLLGGGACVDSALLRRMTAEQRRQIHAAGGLYRFTLSEAVRYFAPRYPAIFGYCGDPLAGRIDRAVGFQTTPYPNLLVCWTRSLSEAEKNEWIEKANEVGAF